MRIEWTLAAQGDALAIAEHIAVENANAALAQYGAIRDQVGYLADHPYMGRAGRVAGTRELVIGRTPYLVAYRIETEVVVILRVLHGAQRWPAKL